MQQTETGPGRHVPHSIAASLAERVPMGCPFYAVGFKQSAYHFASDVLGQLDVAGAGALLVGAPHRLPHVARHQPPVHQLQLLGDTESAVSPAEL